jgi:hypothetical protein
MHTIFQKLLRLSIEAICLNKIKIKKNEKDLEVSHQFIYSSHKR